MLKRIFQNKQGQARGIDLMAAMILFLLVMTQMTFFTVEQIQDSGSQAITFNQSSAARVIADGLLSSPGYPEKWETLSRISFPNDFVIGLSGTKYGEVDAAKIGRLYLESPVNWRLSYNDLVIQGRQVFNEWDMEVKFYPIIKVEITKAAFTTATSTTIDVSGIITYNSYPAQNIDVYITAVGNPNQLGSKTDIIVTTDNNGQFSTTLTGTSQNIYVVGIIAYLSEELQGSAWAQVTRPGETAPTEVTSIVTHSSTSSTILPEEMIIMDHSVSAVTASTHWIIYLTKQVLYIHSYDGSLDAAGTEWRANFNLPPNGLALIVSFGRQVQTGTDNIVSYSVRNYPQPITGSEVTALTPLVTSPEKYTFTRAVYSRGVILILEVSIWQK